MITAAAIKTEVNTYRGYSHADALFKMMDAHDDGTVQINGFLTDGGTFLSRQDAYTHAQACGQVKADGMHVCLQSWMIDI